MCACVHVCVHVCVHACVCACVCVCACACAVHVHACVHERERERKCVRESVCVCCGKKGGGGWVCGCVCAFVGVWVSVHGACMYVGVCGGVNKEGRSKNYEV